VALTIVGTIVLDLDPRGYFTDSIPVWKGTQPLIEEWARVPPLPTSAHNLKYEVRGGTFSRVLIVSFEDDPGVIERWLRSCSGLTDPKCEIEHPGDGVIRYSYPGGGGAVRGEITHDPAHGKVRVRTYWS